MKCTWIFLLFTIQISFAATNIDSLKQVAFDLDNNDTIRTRALNSIAFDGFIFSNVDSTRYYAQMAIDLSESFYYKMGIADATKTIGDSYLVGGGYDEAVPFYEKALEIFNEIKSPKGEAYLLNNLAGIYQYQGKLDQSIDMYIWSLDINEQLGNESIFGELYFNIASLYQTLEQYDKAISYAQKAIESEGNTRTIAQANHLMANLQMRKADYVSALHFVTIAEQLAEESDDEIILVEAYITKGELYFDQGKELDAESEWERALLIAKGLDDRQYSSKVELKLAKHYYKEGNTRKAIRFWRVHCKRLKHLR